MVTWSLRWVAPLGALTWKAIITKGDFAPTTGSTNRSPAEGVVFRLLDWMLEKHTARHSIDKQKNLPSKPFDAFRV